jgi:hypothetical protein
MSNTLTIQIIEEARNLLASPRKGTRHHLAKTAQGESCDPWEPRAVRFCAYGALLKAAHDASRDPVIAHHFAASAVTTILTGEDDTDLSSTRLFQINDSQGRKAILDLFDKALAAR